MKRTNIYFTTFEYNHESTFLAATANGLSWAGGFNEDFQEMEAWFERKVPGSILEENQEMLSSYVKQFKEYFEATRETFDFPLDLHGTPFQLSVWEALQNIPYGETVTYSDIATALENPKAIRAVGTAIGKNPVLIAIPCHRVINKNGSLGGFRGGLPLKRTLLNIEKQRTL